ncbi:hypothetical protein WZ78_09920 [Leuconostoc mesenteroides subsp. dextranicum]|nr:hypothetical protein WZ78_09920 [Leuconostoc mesenteroides subsp. dextranicum]
METNKILIIIGYVLMFIFAVNLIISSICCYRDVTSGVEKRKVIKNFFKNLIFGWFKILDLLLFFV